MADQKEAEEHAKKVSELRILTDADFRLIRIQRLRQQAGLERAQKRKKTNDELRVEEEIQEKFARFEMLLYFIYGLRHIRDKWK